MKKITKRALTIALIFVILLSLGACAGGNSSSPNTAAPAAAPESGSTDTAALAPPSVPAPDIPPGQDSFATDSESVASTPMPSVAADAPASVGSMPAPMPSDNSYSYSGSADTGASDSTDSGAGVDLADPGTGASGSDGNAQSGRKIAFNASFSINTKNFDADYNAINSLVTQFGGYVANENTTDYSSYGRNDGRTSWMSARIPSYGYDSFINGLSSVGDVTNKSKSSTDMTAQYFDTQARIDMLELRKERLMGYLVDAKDAKDIVTFERELANVLYELDQYQSSKRQMDQLVDFATVDINLTEIITPETIGKDGEPLGSRASDAFAFSAGGVGGFLQGVVVFFAGAAPVIALLAVIAVIIWLVLRATRNMREKASEKREEKQAKREEKRMEKLRQKQSQAPVYYGQYAPQPVPPQPQPVPQQPENGQPKK